MRNRQMIVMLIGAFIAAQGSLAQDAAALKGPKIACEQPVYDFGEMDNSQDVTHTFVLRNDGDKTLEIANVRPSCGCTVAHISQKSVPPGEESMVTTKLSLRGRQGRQKKGITVTSNDAKTPNFMLYIEGESTSGVEIRPNRLFFGQLGGDEEASRSVEIQFKTDDPVVIKAVSVDSPSFDTDLTTVEEGKSYSLAIRTKPPLSEGRQQAVVKIATDHASYKELTVPVAITVVGQLAVAPHEIVLTAQNASRPATRYVVVRPGKVKKFEISQVDSPSPDVSVQVLPMGQNGYRIQIDNLLPTPELNGKELTIHTDVADMKPVRIPIRVIEASPALKPKT